MPELNGAIKNGPSDDPFVHEAAVQKGVREAVLAHAHAGFSVPTWRDGKVVWLQPDEILAQFNGKAIPREVPAK